MYSRDCLGVRFLFFFFFLSLSDTLPWVYWPRIFSITRHEITVRFLSLIFLSQFSRLTANLARIGGYDTYKLYIIIHIRTYTYICSGSTRFSQVSLRGSTRILFSQALNVCKCSRCYIYIYSLLTYFTSSPNCFPFPFVVVVDQPSHLSASVWPAVYIPPREFNDFSLIYT